MKCEYPIGIMAIFRTLNGYNFGTKSERNFCRSIFFKMLKNTWVLQGKKKKREPGKFFPICHKYLTLAVTTWLKLLQPGNVHYIQIIPSRIKSKICQFAHYTYTQVFGLWLIYLKQNKY